MRRSAADNSEDDQPGKRARIRRPILPIYDRLTSSEIEELRRNKKEVNAFFRQEFARLFLETDILQKKFGGDYSEAEIEKLKQAARATLARFQDKPGDLLPERRR
jgi:hypothetical protein